MTRPAVDEAGRHWVSVSTAAKWLDLAEGTVYQKLYRGQIPFARLGRTIRVNWKRLEAQLEGQAKKS